MNKVHLIDCMQFMKNIPDGHYDLAIVDPPYFSGPETGGFYGNTISNSRHSKNRIVSTIQRTKYKKLNKWEVPGKEYFIELRRISKNQIIWGINYFLNQSFMSGRIIWNKVNDASMFSDAEIALCSLHDSVREIYYMWNGMMQGKSVEDGKVQQGNKNKNEKRIHPTQKPIVLYKWLLKNYAKPGDKIFDSHVGSGSIRIACHDLGFDFEGCEIDDICWNDQEDRYKKHISQANLFGKEEMQRLVYGEKAK